MLVQMDLPELGLTGEAVVTDIRAAPSIEPLSGPHDDRRIVTATFHHSSGDVIDLVLADAPQRTHHSPRDDLRRDSIPPTKALSRHDAAPQSTSSAASTLTAESNEAQATVPATPHHAERDEYFESPNNSLPPDESHTFADTHKSTPHLNTENCRLKTLGEAEPIGTTSNHPFWSVDRQEYVQAGQLRVGERLQTLHGDTKIVVSNLPRPGPKTNVYNLEVHAEHTYFVGQDGVLVHNSAEYARNHSRFVQELSDAGVTGEQAQRILRNIKENFSGWDNVKISRTTRERSFWRRWGGTNADGSIGAAGRRSAWGTVGPRSRTYTLEKVAVIPDFGGGDLSKLSRWRLRKGSLVIEGPAGPQKSIILGRTVPGGGHQLYVPEAYAGALIKPRTVE
ncbi:MAG: polymorphic toxin-type HINT domain-containing protein [Planctomycetaceae bacterium]